MEETPVQKPIQRLIDNIETIIVGKTDAVRFLSLGLLTGGHVLIEDVPGVGKTMLAKSLARSVSGAYTRVQFTPDILPSDVTGANVFNMKTNEFEFRKGPVFTNILLADEINRGTPRAQSSLLECMEEGVVSADGAPHEIPEPFFVMATQNPIEYYGTYPLPEAQLDRFALQLHLGYPGQEQENTIAATRIHGEPIRELQPVMGLEEVGDVRDKLRNIHISDSVRDYAVRLCIGTRTQQDVRLGASPRGSIWLLRIAQGIAALHNRTYVIPQDIKDTAIPVLSHRIILNSYTQQENTTAADIVRAVTNQVPVPVVRDAVQW